MAEGIKAPVLKIGARQVVPWVRIPLSPPLALRFLPRVGAVRDAAAVADFAYGEVVISWRSGYIRSRESRLPYRLLEFPLSYTANATEPANVKEPVERPTTLGVP